MPITVVVPTRDRAELLEGALDALVAAQRPGDEVLVVDSASQDGRVREVAEAAGVGYLRCDQPGVSLARNAGWRAARHDLVAFVDDDVRVSSEWAAVVEEAFDDRTVAFLTGRVLEPPGEPSAVRAVAIKDEVEPVALDRETRGVFGHTANAAFRREALLSAGGFDEQLGPGGPLDAGAEDVDLFDRLVTLGYRGRYEPAALVWHLQWRSRPALVKVEWQYGLGAGLRIAKLRRTDHDRARWVSRAVLRWCFGDIIPALRRGHESIALLECVRAAALLVGLVRGLTLPVLDGHYATRSRRR